MNGFSILLGRVLRGVRLVEFAALLVLLAMVLGVYLAKAAAGRERGDITAVQAQIEDESKRLRLLQAEVAHLEEPLQVARLFQDLSQIAQGALVPEKPGKQVASISTGAPQ